MAKKRILLIEDEVDMVYVLTLQLEAIHYEVLSAADVRFMVSTPVYR